MKLGTNKHYYQMICKKNNDYRKYYLHAANSFIEEGPISYHVSSFTYFLLKLPNRTKQEKPWAAVFM